MQTAEERNISTVAVLERDDQDDAQDEDRGVQEQPRRQHRSERLERARDALVELYWWADIFGEQSE